MDPNTIIKKLFNCNIEVLKQILGFIGYDVMPKKEITFQKLIKF